MPVALRIAVISLSVALVCLPSCDRGKTPEAPETAQVESESAPTVDILELVVPAIAARAKAHGPPSRTFVPRKVELVWPPDGLAHAAQPLDLTWRPVNKSLGYRVQVAGEAGFSKPTLDVLTEKTSLYLKGSGGPLFWRVRAKAEGGEGPWSEVRSFKFAP